MVPEAGIEPARHFWRGILSPLRLPISPLRPLERGIGNYGTVRKYEASQLPDDRRRDRQDAARGAAAHRCGREQRARKCGARQARRQQPGGLREGPAGAFDDQARRGARRDQAGRHVDRSHLGQHRHCAGHGRGHPRLSHGADHAGGPVGRARADHEGVWRRTRAHAQERGHGIRARPGREHAKGRQGPRAGPVRQCGQPAHPLRDDGPGTVGQTRRAASPTS